MQITYSISENLTGPDLESKMSNLENKEHSSKYLFKRYFYNICRQT